MNFENKIREFEEINGLFDYLLIEGVVPVLVTAPHTMKQVRDDGSIKYEEPFTKAIALYLNDICKCSCLIKTKDTGLDSNRDNHDEFKDTLINYVNDNNIRLVIDLHGADHNRDFDVEFGTMNNLTADVTTLKELEEAFKHNGIDNIEYNNPFKGGAITQYLYNIRDVEVIQLEINGRFRDYKHIVDLGNLCQSLIYFIEQYVNHGE